MSRFGEEYDYTEDGIRRTGDADHGECGIIISKIDFAQSGTWKCEVLRKQRPGSGKKSIAIFK